MVQRVNSKVISTQPSDNISRIDLNVFVTLSLHECPSLHTSGL